MIKKWWEEIEVIVDGAIPYLLLVLLGIIIIEFFFKELALKYHTFISILDWIIIAFFVIDLIFKYLRIRVLPIFLKRYWLDILAVFPFFLVFRLFEEVARLLGEVKELPLQMQKVVHVGLELKEARLAEEAAKLTKEVEGASELSRTERFARFLIPAEKAPKVLKTVAFYEDPKHKHHLKKHLKEIKREVEQGEVFVEKEAKKGEKLFKEVEEEVIDEFRRHHRSKNKRKNIQRRIRSINRQKSTRSQTRKRL